MGLTRGGAKGTRTPNPLLAKQVRYQLRHGPKLAEARPERPARPTHDRTPTDHAEPISEPPQPTQHRLLGLCLISRWGTVQVNEAK